MPKQTDFAHFHDQYQKLAKAKLEQLDQKLDSGEITQETHARNKQELETNVSTKVNDLIFHNHLLKENESERMGLPTPKVELNTPNTGQGFGHYKQRSNNQDGSIGSPNIIRGQQTNFNTRQTQTSNYDLVY